MLKHRLLMSALLIPATIGLFVWDHQMGATAPVLLVVVLMIAARCAWELVTLARRGGFQPDLALCCIGCWLPLLANWLPQFAKASPFVEPIWDGWFIALGLGFALLAFNAIWRYSNSADVMDPAVSAKVGMHLGNLAVEVLVITYIGIQLGITSQLRWGYAEIRDDHDIGYFALGAVIVATKMGDVGAYTFGRLIGGPKMTPKLSPGKTWAGGVGHLLTAGLCSVGWLCWLGPMISSSWQAWGITSAAVFGVVVGFAGLIGDLAESLIKRDVGVKDAPALLPGFGGLLDLMDSILLAGPVSYAMWHLLR